MQKNMMSVGFGKALLMTVGVVVMVVLYFLYMALFDIGDNWWISFVFLWYYASIKHVNRDEWLPSVCGSLFGFAMTGLSISLHSLWGSPIGPGVFTAFVFVVVLLHIMGRFGLWLNAATFLFLTVGSIPAIQSSPQEFVKLFMALVIGVAFWSALSVLIWFKMSRRTSIA